MFKVSHELPINMLDKSFEINDYEYCLPHLLDLEPKYIESILLTLKRQAATS
jgi:hypothetical protein